MNLSEATYLDACQSGDSFAEICLDFHHCVNFDRPTEFDERRYVRACDLFLEYSSQSPEAALGVGKCHVKVGAARNAMQGS